MKRLISPIILVFTSLCSWAITAGEAFTSAPNSVFPLLDNSTRMDMVDYFNSHMSTASQNKLSGKSRITALSDESLSFEMSSSSAYQIILLPGKESTIIALIETVATPAPDSNISFYDENWKKSEKPLLENPDLDTWLTAEGNNDKAMVESLVPFMLSSMSYDPVTKTLTLTNNVKQFLGEDMYSMVANCLKPALTFKWNGKRFEQVK